MEELKIAFKQNFKTILMQAKHNEYFAVTLQLYITNSKYFYKVYNN